jgi:tRNA nucleotidyltransferase (CCA-adding enzyme)
MRVILTHEQADFDALASLLAAHLLDEAAFPVLPRRMNRNVKAFVTLYGAGLPFVEARDLPSNEIESMLLVDTQGLITLKGITSATKICVVDHHPERDDLPPDWIVRVDQTGATVTLFVESLRERNGILNPIHATLMLLGIYEDTGSLTYSRTTSRDLQAAAYLMDHGASLRIANEFLNHPLSVEQQKIYDQLRADAQTLKIHGHTIVITTGNAEELDEELSTLAHKLRDLLDPDALFLIITTRSGVQIIARSTSDQIDVGQIMADFGGGGHDRAAAALIRDQSISDVLTELRKKLGEEILPVRTVSEIMSHGLRYLSPEVSAREAAELMQRYGYEGYPIVDNGKVIGLLTRRAVDRALAHKMNIRADSLMEAGNNVVTPSASIETLQRKMTESGWGQIPVVSENTGEIVGIVTRTDILKTFNDHARNSGVRNMTNRLEAALPPSRLSLLHLVADMAGSMRLPVYIVGGFVRDLLLDRPSLDFDIVVEGDAVSLADELSRAYGGRVTTHQQFGTAKWYLRANPNKNGDKSLSIVDRIYKTDQPEIDLPPFLDLISARTEFYTHPTALPEVEKGSIKLDLHRRDFTINTLALRLDGQHYGELHDHWGGLNDLRQRLVRVLHSLSFVDDPTRMLRAVRFEQRFGFTIEDRTLHLMEEAKPFIARVTGDRLRHELDHILDETGAKEMLNRLFDLGLLSAIHPNLTWDIWLDQKLDRIPLDEIVPQWAKEIYDKAQNFEWRVYRRNLIYSIWLLRLSETQRKSICRRIRASKSLVTQILNAGILWQNLPKLMKEKQSHISIQLKEFSPAVILSCYLAEDDPEVLSMLKTDLLVWRSISPNYTGDDLRKKGIPPGPVYREILTAIRSAWIDGEVTSADEEEALFEKLVTQAAKLGGHVNG